MKRLSSLLLAVLFNLGTNAHGQDVLGQDWAVSKGSEDQRGFLPKTVPWAEQNLIAESRWSVDNLVNDARCSAPLRSSIFTEVYEKNAALEKKSSMKYLWCKTDVGSESEAKSLKIDMTFVYEAIGIDAHADDRFNKARSWRSTNCGDQQIASYLAESSKEFAKVINTPVAIRALESYDRCISASSFGTNCQAFRYSDRSVGFYINYVPQSTDPTGATKAPKIKSAVVENAHLPGKPGNHEVFQNSRVVPPGGLSSVLVQDDLSKDVIFNVELTQGFPSCKPADLLVKASPTYVVSAHVQNVHAERPISAVFSNTFHVTHVYCNHVALPVPIEVCPGPGYTLDTNVNDWWDATQNPGNPPGRTKNICFGAISGAINGISQNGCVETTVTILECLREEADAACQHAKQDWYGEGSTAIARFPGRKIEKFDTGPIDQSWSEAEGGSQLSLSTPGIPSDAINILPNWTVSVTNTVTKKTVTLSQPGKQADEGVTAIYDVENKKLVIYLPKN